MLQTEYDFTLPCGYVDDDGTLHREGVMRLSTALDEVEAAQDGRGRVNDAYQSIVLLARVVTSLGGISPVETHVIERLFSADFVYLQELFVRVNGVPDEIVETECPSCGARFPIDLAQGVNT
jgi:hypothetical protein